MPNIAFRGGVKWKFELSFGLGIGFVGGGVQEQKLWQMPNSLSQTNINYNIKAWDTKNKLTKGFRIGASYGYLIKKRYLIAAQFGLLNLSAQSTKTLNESNHIWDKDLAQIIQSLDMGNYTVKSKILYQSWFIGLTFKYQIYKTLYPQTITKNGIIYH